MLHSEGDLGSASKKDEEFATRGRGRVFQKVKTQNTKRMVNGVVWQEHKGNGIKMRLEKVSGGQS